MNLRTLIAACLLLLASVVRAAPTPCDAGTIDFSATSYDPAVPLTTFNVGQAVTLTAIPAGIAPSAYAWTIDGPHLKDYDERIGTTLTGPIAWSTTPLAAADLSAPDVTFYWRPSAAQTHPSNAGPESRSVTLEVTVGATTCSTSQTFSVERNATDIDRQAEDFYVRNHRAPSETDLTKGRVLDDHIEWHTVFGTHILEFLPWHHEFIDRANQWRAEFGYPPTVSWYPGNPIPTGPEIDDVTRGGGFNPDFNRIPTQFTLAGGAVGPPKRLSDYATLDDFSNALEFSWHGNVHCNVGGTMCSFESPRDPLFFRWHGLLDQLYANYCSLKGLACAGVTQPPSDLWLADNANDIATGGAEPSSGTMWMSPSLWNRTTTASCTPADPIPTAARSCGTAADHENPIAGVTNYLYATVRNDRPGAQDIRYLEVAVYAANASTGLSWPANFGGDPDGALPESRQFLTVDVPAGQVTDIGPLPWIPPTPTPSDHWCVYVRGLSQQAPISVAEGTSVSANTAANNNIVWRNLQIVINSTDSATFTLQADKERAARVELRIEAPPAFFNGGQLRVLVPKQVHDRWSQAKLEGVKRLGPVAPDREALTALAHNPHRVRMGGSNAPTARELELLKRIAELTQDIRHCVTGQTRHERKHSMARAPATGTADWRREAELLEAIEQLQRDLRTCQRNDANLVALQVTRASSSIGGLTLEAGEAQPITLEFSKDSAVPTDHTVLVTQYVDGKPVGGNTYIVRSGSH